MIFEMDIHHSLKIGLLKNEQQLVIKDFGLLPSDFSETEVQSERAKVFDSAQILEQEFDFLLLDDNLALDSNSVAIDLVSNLEKIKKFRPVRHCRDFKLDLESFETLSHHQAITLGQQIYGAWTLQNNLNLLNRLFNTLEHLNQFWPNDRTNFFEELWFILKSNLGASELTLIYNDLKKAEKEGEKNKLVQVRITGKTLPHFFPGGEIEKQLLKDFEKEFLGQFHVIEHNKTSGQFSATFTINHGPVLIMAQLNSFGPLQQALISSFITGLNRDKNTH